MLTLHTDHEQALHGISHREWQNIRVMPDGFAYRIIEDACGTLFHALEDLAPAITLTWPPARQPSLGTEGGQPYTPEFQQQLLHMGDVERKWYLKQHEFTTSVQRCVFSSSLTTFFFWLNKANKQESHAPRTSRTTCPRRPRRRI